MTSSMSQLKRGLEFATIDALSASSYKCISWTALQTEESGRLFTAQRQIWIHLHEQRHRPDFTWKSQNTIDKHQDIP